MKTRIRRHNVKMELYPQLSRSLTDKPLVHSDHWLVIGFVWSSCARGVSCKEYSSSRPLRHAAETWGGRRSALTLSWQRRSEVASLRPQPRTHSATGETCSLSPTEDFATLSLLTHKGQTFPTGKLTWLLPSVIAFFVNFLLVSTSFSVVSLSAYRLSVRC